MKVLFCTNAFEEISNGPAKFAHLLLNGAAAAGFEVQLLTEDITTETPTVHKLTIKMPGFLQWSSQFYRMWKYHRAAMAIRKNYPFDIIVYNNAIIGLLSYVFFKPAVGMINDDNNSHCSFSAVLSGKVKLKSAVVFHYVEWLSCKLAKKILVNSIYLKNTLRKEYHCKDELFKILYKGIETDLVAADRAALLDKKKSGSILFVKTDFVRGGLLTLIEALKNADKNIKLYIVGPAAKHHNMLENLLKEANICYELYSYLPPAEIYLLMERSEIFCVPSFLEAFGVANLEAMAMGCKIVSSNIGGIPEAVGSNRFAWLITPGNVTELRAAITDAFSISIKDDVDAIDEHLHQFSATAVLLRFKAILQTCL